MSNQGRRRHRRARLASFGLAVYRLSGLVLTLLSVPLLFQHLGVERFGLWLALSSLAALLAFADFGIGAGMMNSISSADGRDDVAGIRRATSSGLAALAAAGLALGAVGTIAAITGDWGTLLRASGANVSAELRRAGIVLVLCLAVGIPTSLVHRVTVGLQLGWMSNLSQTCGNALAMAGIIVGVSLGYGLPWFVFCLFGGPVAASVAFTAWFLGYQRPDLRPRTTDVSRATTRKIVRQGVVFFVLQLTAAVAFFSDNLVLSALAGPEAVPTYAVPARLFSYVSLGVGVLLTPLWPAYAEALSRGDHSWVKAVLRKSLWLALGISAAGSLFLNLFADLIFHTWVGPEYAVDRRIIAALGFWTVIESVGMAVAMFLNGASILRPQIVIASALLVTSLALRIVLIQWIGVLGSPIATIAAYIVTTLIPYAILLSSLVRGVTSTYDPK